MSRDRLSGEPSAASDPVVASDSRPCPSRLVDSTPLLDAQPHSRQFDGCEGLGEERLSLGEQDAGLLLRRLHGGGGGMRADRKRMQTFKVALFRHLRAQRWHWATSIL